MKKMLIIILLFLVLICNLQQKEFSLLNYFEGEFSVYNNQDTGINLGFCSVSDDIKIDNKIGESMLVKNTSPDKALKVLNAEVVKTEVLENGANVIYAYTDLVKSQVILKNEKVNIQIACYQDYFVIGWPLILGGY